MKLMAFLFSLALHAGVLLWPERARVVVGRDTVVEVSTIRSIATVRRRQVRASARVIRQPDIVEKIQTTPDQTLDTSMRAVAAQGNALPQYPPEAEERGWEAMDLLLEFWVNADGKVISWKWLRQPTQLVFQQAVEEVLPQWHFGGVGQATSYRLPIQFRLGDG